MSDRCHVYITCLKTDQDELTAFLGVPDGVEDVNDIAVQLEYWEADGGLGEAREKAAVQGAIPFYGHHGAGIEYGPYVFASALGNMLENEVSLDGNLFLAVSDDIILARDPDVQLAAFDGLREYLALQATAVRIVKGNVCTFCGQPECDLNFGACDEAQAGGF